MNEDLEDVCKLYLTFKNLKLGNHKVKGLVLEGKDD